MSRFRFSSKLPTDGSNTGTVDPDSTKKPITKNNQNHKPERYITQTERLVDHVDVPVLANEYKFTVQTKVEAGHPAHAQTQFSHAKQKRTSTPVSQPKEFFLLATNNNKPLNPIHFHNLNPSVKKEHAKDYGIINNRQDRPKSVVLEEKSQVRDKKYSLPRKSYGAIDEKGDKPLTLVRNLGFRPVIAKGEETKNNASLEEEWEKTRSLVHKRPEEVDKFIAKETEQGLLREENWHDISCTNVYGDYNFRKKELNKSGTDTVSDKQVLEPFGSWKKWMIRYNQVLEPFGSWKNWMERA